MRLIPIATLALAAATLAACAGVQAAPGADSGPLTYRCAGGKRFTAAWNQPGDRVKVTAGGVTKSLPAATSAWGARNAAGGYEIWGKGAGATLSGFPGGPYNACTTG